MRHSKLCPCIICIDRRNYAARRREAIEQVAFFALYATAWLTLGIGLGAFITH